MNTEQVIEFFEGCKHDCGNPEFINMAISALRNQQERENPKPLSLEEFRKLCEENRDSGKEKWVWCVGYEKDDGWKRVSSSRVWANILTYGVIWKAYAHEPKEGGGEA